MNIPEDAVRVDEPSEIDGEQVDISYSDDVIEDRIFNILSCILS